MCWKLILRFVGDQSDLYRACVMVSKTNGFFCRLAITLCIVEEFAANLIGFRGF